ncbi:MAG: phytanoyl-CoA dioxygenase family protein [Isosphaeraceae bacterium]|nr:phytanoyl-CoA dioxygenase family protein [Isosphaeraceae bacterium]
MDLLTASERQHLDDDGYLALEGIVPPHRVQAMRDRLQELLAITEQDHCGTLIVAGLLAEEVFDAAWLHPRVLAAVRQVLGDGFRLTGVASRGIQPGYGQQALHVDWGGQGVPGVWYGCHAICALVDFTRDNGATRVVPGSHRNPWILKSRHDPRKPHPAQRQLTGAAGTIFVLNIHCGHSAVHNATNEPRLAIFTSFTRRDSPLLLANPVPDPSPKMLARFSAEVQALLKG